MLNQISVQCLGELEPVNDVLVLVSTALFARAFMGHFTPVTHMAPGEWSA